MARAKGVGQPTGKKPFGSEYLDSHSGKVWIQKGDFNTPNWQEIDIPTTVTTTTNTLVLLATASSLFVSSTQSNLTLESGITALNYCPVLLMVVANTTDLSSGGAANISLVQSAQYLATSALPAVGETLRMSITGAVKSAEPGGLSNWILGNDGFSGLGANDATAKLYGFLIPS